MLIGCLGTKPLCTRVSPAGPAILTSWKCGMLITLGFLLVVGTFYLAVLFFNVCCLESGAQLFLPALTR